MSFCNLKDGFISNKQPHYSYLNRRKVEVRLQKLLLTGTKWIVIMTTNFFEKK